MAKQTLQQRFISSLEAVGYTRVMNAKSRKYIVMHRAQEPGFYYVGSSGALRVGRSVSESHPVSDGVKRELLGASAVSVIERCPYCNASVNQLHTIDCPHRPT